MTGFTSQEQDPDEVRDQPRRGLWRDLETPAGFRARTPIAIAAVASLLVAGAVLVTRTDSSTSDATSTGPMDSQSSEQLERCRQAARTVGSPAAASADPDWTLLFDIAISGIAVLGADVDGKTVFCESTPTSVTVSDPDAAPARAPGTRTAVVFVSANGIIAGRLDPTWESVLVTTPGGRLTDEPVVSSGLFVASVNRQLRPDTPLQIQQLRAGPSSRPSSAFPMYDLPPAPAPLVSIVDRPVAADRGSAAGRQLEQCMRDSLSPQPDRDSWSPGAVVSTPDGGELIMAVNGNGTAVCERRRPNKWESFNEFTAYLPYGDHSTAPEAAQYTLSGGQSTDLVLAGIAPADAAAIAISVDNRVTIETAVSNGTFAVNVPDEVRKQGEIGPDSVRAVLRDRTGRTLYQGTLRLA